MSKNMNEERSEGGKLSRAELKEYNPETYFSHAMSVLHEKSGGQTQEDLDIAIEYLEFFANNGYPEARKYAEGFKKYGAGYIDTEEGRGARKFDSNSGTFAMDNGLSDVYDKLVGRKKD